jgi:AcrR family transcriptional regulator
MAKVRTPRGAWIEAGLRALAEGGPDAVRIEALAARLGVSKGGFYWHFTDRRSLLVEMLDSWEKIGTEEIIERVDSRSAEPRAKVQRLFELSSSADFAVELAIRDWSRRDGEIAERLHRIDNRRMGYLRSLFGRFCAEENDIEARSMLAYSLLIGSYFIAAQHDGKTRAQVLQLAVDRLLDESWN